MLFMLDLFCKVREIDISVNLKFKISIRFKNYVN